MGVESLTSKLSAQDWAILERRIRSEGGNIESGKCEGAEIDDGKGNTYSTCACGGHRRVSIPYDARRAGGVEELGLATLCANCDGVARTPRFAYTRGAEPT